MVQEYQHLAISQTVVAVVLTNLYKMESKVNRPSRLLAELRAATGSNADECDMCLIMNKIVCDHLTQADYASLKATKRTVATERARGDILRVFSCGHVYDALRPVRCTTRGPKEKTHGFCPDCWRHIASEGRRKRPARDRGKRRPSDGRYKPKEILRRRLGADTTRPSRFGGQFRVWRVRGPMVGKVPV
ncbi:hypothetical protein CIB48_g7431 [Xylaria polymorpha]|nr:hypothetical protein CIB48_g7431 [Xylaria polymorpha]